MGREFASYSGLLSLSRASSRLLAVALGTILILAVLLQSGSGTAATNETTGQGGQLINTSTNPGHAHFAISVGSDGKYYAATNGGIFRWSASGTEETSFWPGWVAKAIATGGGLVFYSASTQGIMVYPEGSSTRSYTFNKNVEALAIVRSPATGKVFAAHSSTLRMFNTSSLVEGGTHDHQESLGGTINELRIQNIGGTEYVLAAGAFGVKRYLTSTGALDTSFSEFTGTFTALAVDPVDNSILVGTSSNVFRYPANGGTPSPALLASTQSVASMAVDSKRRIVVSANPGVRRFSADGTPDLIFNANANAAGMETNDLVIGPDGRIAATSTTNTAPRYFRLYRGDSAKPEAPTISSAVGGIGKVTVTVARTGTVIASSFIVTAVEDPSKTCTIAAVTPASGLTSSTGGSCDVEGLTADTPYTFTAVAVNLDEVSEVSSASNPATPDAGPPPSLAVENPLTLIGNELYVKFNEPLLGSPLPPTSSFAVNYESARQAISSVRVEGSSVVLTLAQTPVGPGLLSVAYTAPAASSSTSNAAIQGLGGSDALSFNLSMSVPAPGPALLANNALAVSGSTISLNFDEPLLASAPPLASQFEIYVDNLLVQPSSISISGSTLVLNMPSSIAAGAKVSVSYSPPIYDASISNSAIQNLSGEDASAFNVVTPSAAGVWNWDPSTPHVAPNPSTGCDGAGSINRIKQTVLPNGVSYGVGVTGAHICINEVTESLSQRGGEPQHFVSAGLVTEPGLKLSTSNLDCSSALGGERLCSRGELTIYFSQPVLNPVMSFSGLGGWANNNNVSSLSWTELKLKTPSVEMQKLSGTNIQVVDSGTYLKLETNRPSPNCNQITSQHGSTAVAGCGSIQLNGVMSSVTFEVFVGTYNGPGFLDAWNMTVNVAEDFGLVPSALDNPVASHVVGDLRLGATVEADQASALYGTTNPDAVEAGVSLHNNPKADDGIAAWISPPGATASPLVDLVPGENYSVTASLNGVTSEAYICAWIDFNRDYVFSWDERVCETLAPGASSVELTWVVPANLKGGLIYTRVRLSSEPIYSPLGKMNSGEVEDYSIFQALPELPIPVANPDVSAGPINTAQSASVLENDQPGTGATLVASSVKICGPGETAPDCNFTTLPVDGEGTYTVDTETGVISFMPEASFVGTASGIDYVVSDSNEEVASSTYTPRVVAAPTASPDAISAAYDTNQNYSPIANDTPGAVDFPLLASTLKLCDAGQTPPNCTATSLTVAGEGTYTVNTTTGVVTFDPLPTFVGVATPVSYQVSDSLDRTATATINPTVGPPPAPTASPDVSSGTYDEIQEITVLGNDNPGANSFQLVATTVKLCDPESDPVEVAPDCTLTSLTIAGEGTYTVDPISGEVTFDPLPTFTGPATQIRYQVSDSRGVVANSTINVSVDDPAVPVLTPDTSSGNYNTAQTEPVLANDLNVEADLDPTTVKLCAAGDTAPNCTATTLEVAGQGTYSVHPTTGAVTFTPLATFVGQATPVTYSVEDITGQKASTTYTPTVGPPTAPNASPDSSTGDYDTNQTFSVIGNDTAGAAAFQLEPTTVKLCASGESAPNCTRTSLEVAGQGTYTVDPISGEVTFDPLPTFTGPATQIRYQVSDSRGVVANSTINVTVDPPAAPVLTADTSSGAMNATQVKAVLANDTNTDAALEPTSVRLCKTEAPADTAPNCTLTSLTTAEGTYTVNPTTGAISFTPVNGFVGEATAVTYSATDITGQKASTTYTPTVIGTPTANPDTTTGKQGDQQVINLLTNVDGADSAASGATLDPTTVKLCGAGESPNTCTKTDVVIAGVGTYAVNSAGVMTFTPLPEYFGTPPPLSYIVKDDLGQVATSTYTPSVFPAPNAVDDVSIGKQGQVQIISLIANDLAGAGSTLGSGAIKLCDPGDGTLPPDCTKTTVIIAGVGTYSIDSSGVMTFTPEANFTGTPAPLNYRLTDSSTQFDIATYTPTVVPPPTATADVSSGEFNSPQSHLVVANDTAGAGTTLDASSVRLCGAGDTAPNCTQTSLTTADGTYSVNSTTGAITFTPVTGFYGQATAVTYSVSDALGQKASTTYTPTVAPPAPTAVNDAISDDYDTNQVYNPIANDPVPAFEYPLSPTTLKLCGVGQTSPNCTATSLTVAGEGTYTVNTTTGAVTFDPLPSFVGTATPVSYQVSDSLGRTVTATITPTVGPPPVPTASNDAISAAYDTNQNYSPIANDTPGALDFPLLASTLKLCDAGQSSPNCTATSLTVAGEGTYTVNTTTGVVTFDPLPTFVGVATPVSYQVSDSLGRTATATINPTVGPPPAPNASPDSSTGPYDQNQTINPLANDTAGATAFPLVATTVKLCDPESDPVEVAPDCTLTSLTIAGEGTYTVDPISGEVTFDPLPTFTGPATQIRYQVSDSRNQVTNSTINVSVSPPVAPALVDDYSTDIVNLTQVFSITSNDVAAPGLTIDASTARLCADGETPNACTETRVTVAGVGTYTLAANGVITFVPVTDYVGEADPISYVVSDSFGQVATAQIYVVVTPTPKPLAVDDSSTDSVNRTQTINLLTNDSSPTGYPLVPGSVTLCGLDPAEASPNCTQTSVEIAEQGTLTISNGIVTFTPVANFVGEVDPVSYQVANSYGEKATAVIYITVTPAPVINETPPAPPAPPITAEQEPWPTATPDKNSGPLNSVISISPWLNDQQALSPLEAQSIMLCPNGCMLANGEVSTAMVTELRVAEGTWSVDPETGVVSFTPKHNWHGTVSVNYAIWAADGKMAHSHLTVTIKPGERVQEPLAATGFDSQTLAIFALLLMLAGGLLISRGRRPLIPQGEDFSIAVPTRA